jgi:hypothetical protein
VSLCSIDISAGKEGGRNDRILRLHVMPSVEWATVSWARTILFSESALKLSCLSLCFVLRFPGSAQTTFKTVLDQGMYCELCSEMSENLFFNGDSGSLIPQRFRRDSVAPLNRQWSCRSRHRNSPKWQTRLPAQEAEADPVGLKLAALS